MHEFGHTVGLYDLYKLGAWGNSHTGEVIYAYPGYIMTDPEKQTSIPSKDRDYLLDAYRNHSPHPRVRRTDDARGL